VSGAVFGRRNKLIFQQEMTEPTTTEPPQQSSTTTTLLECIQIPTLLSGVSARVRYTCMSLSTRLIAFGANSGSFYVFSIHTSQLTRVGSFAELKGQAIERTLWLAADRLLVLAARKLILVVDVESAKPKIVARVPRADDAGAVVDCCVARPLFLSYANSDATLLDDSLSLFVGDSRGRLVAHTMRRRALGTVVRSDLLFDFNAPIVQLDVAPGSDALLVSTTSLSLVLKPAADPSAPPLQIPIGTKPRDGLYGAAFHRDGTVVFAARPGKRLWRADAASGNVEATFNFAPSLQTLPESPLLSAAAREAVLAAFPARTQPLVFSRVLPLPMYSNNLLFASESDAVFVIDLANGNVVQWSQDLREIIDVQLRVAVVNVAGEDRYAVEIYVLHSCPAPATNSVARLTVMPLPDERPPASASVSYIDEAGTVQPAVLRGGPLVDSGSDSSSVVTAPDSQASAATELIADVDVGAASTAAAAAAVADDGVVKKIRRRKTTQTTSRRHAEIESGGVAFVPTAPIQRAVVAPGESSRIDRATLDAVLGRSSSNSITAPIEDVAPVVTAATTAVVAATSSSS
jgi:hypothetical protein